jgi:hypothetical protein
VAWILAAGVCVFAIGFFYLLARHAAKVEENIQPVPPTAYLGDELFPAFPPTGHRSFSLGAAILNQVRRVWIYM